MMNENRFMEGSMLTEIVQPQTGEGPNSETDLSALAEHLSVIAEALRKTTGRTAQGDTQANQGRDRSPNEMLPRPSVLVSGNGASQEQRTAPASHPDAKMQRRRFAALAREAYAIRRRRAVIFDNDELFGEPAWDILLDLYIAYAEGKSVSVSSACIGSAAPPTTGLRWLGILSEQGLILREQDPEDQRRVLVRLTAKSLTAMDEYFSKAGLTA
jgi:hypothetical protein